MKLSKEFISIINNKLITEETLNIDRTNISNREIDSPADVKGAKIAMDVKSPQSWDSKGNISGGEIVEKFKGIKTWYPYPPKYDYITKDGYDITTFTYTVKIDGNLVQTTVPSNLLVPSNNTDPNSEKSEFNLYNTFKSVSTKDATYVAPKPVMKITESKDVLSFIYKNYVLRSGGIWSEIGIDKGSIKIGVNPRTCGEIAWSLFDSPWSNKSYVEKEYNSVNGATILKIAKERVKSGYYLGGEEKPSFTPEKPISPSDATYVAPKYKINPKIGQKESIIDKFSNILKENFNDIENTNNEIFKLLKEQLEDSDALKDYQDWEIFVELALNSIARDAFWDFITGDHTWSVEVDLWGKPKSSNTTTTSISDKTILSTIINQIKSNTYKNKLDILSKDIYDCAKGEYCKFLVGPRINNIIEIFGGEEKIKQLIKSIYSLQNLYSDPIKNCQILNLIGQIGGLDFKNSLVKLLNINQEYCKTSDGKSIANDSMLKTPNFMSSNKLLIPSVNKGEFDKYLGKITLNYNFKCKDICQTIEQSVTAKQLGLRQFLSQEDFNELKKELDAENPNVDWHNILMVASLLTIFIPGSIFVRLAISTGLDVIDGAVYLNEGNKTAAALTILMGLLPEIVESSVKGAGKIAGNLMDSSDKKILKGLIDYDGGKSLISKIKKGSKLSPQDIAQLNAIAKNKNVFQEYIKSNVDIVKKLLKDTDPNVISNLKKEFSSDFKKQFGRTMTDVDSKNLIRYLNATIKLNKPLELAARGAGILSALSMITTEFTVTGGNEGVFRQWFLKQIPPEALKSGWDWTTLKLIFYQDHPPFGENSKENLKYYETKKDKKGNEQYVLKSQSVVDEWKKGWRPKNEIGGYKLKTPEEVASLSTISNLNQDLLKKYRIRTQKNTPSNKTIPLNRDKM